MKVKMKTKKLIEILNDLDPSGELECCVDNQDIFFVEKLPAYYDGRQEILIRDESNPYYNVIGAKITSRGTKLKIRTLSIEDAIWDNVNLPIDLSECCDNSDRYAMAIASWRKAAEQSKIEVEKWAKENGLPKKGDGPVSMITIKNIVE